MSLIRVNTQQSEPKAVGLYELEDFPFVGGFLGIVLTASGFYYKEDLKDALKKSLRFSEVMSDVPKAYENMLAYVNYVRNNDIQNGVYRAEYLPAAIRLRRGWDFTPVGDVYYDINSEVDYLRVFMRIRVRRKTKLGTVGVYHLELGFKFQYHDDIQTSIGIPYLNVMTDNMFKSYRERGIDICYATNTMKSNVGIGLAERTSFPFGIRTNWKMIQDFFNVPKNGDSVVSINIKGNYRRTWFIKLLDLR